MTRPHQVGYPEAYILSDILILFSHPKTVKINQPLIGKKFMCRFPTGEIYYESKLDLDTDGSVYSKRNSNVANRSSRI